MSSLTQLKNSLATAFAPILNVVAPILNSFIQTVINVVSISITAGSGTRSISLSNPFMTQAVLNKILASFKNFSYMPGTLKMLGDPRLDPWDILTVTDLFGNTYKVPIMKLDWEYDGGLTYSVEAVGLSEEAVFIFPPPVLGLVTGLLQVRKNLQFRCMPMAYSNLKVKIHRWNLIQ